MDGARTQPRHLCAGCCAHKCCPPKQGCRPPCGLLSWLVFALLSLALVSGPHRPPLSPPSRISTIPYSHPYPSLTRILAFTLTLTITLTFLSYTLHVHVHYTFSFSYTYTYTFTYTYTYTFTYPYTYTYSYTNTNTAAPLPHARLRCSPQISCGVGGAAVANNVNSALGDLQRRISWFKMASN